MTSGWVWEPEPEHKCTPPSGAAVNKHPAGAIWRCGECSQYWEVARYLKSPDGAANKRMVPISSHAAEARMGHGSISRD